jgi:hypothetical protein
MAIPKTKSEPSEFREVIETAEYTREYKEQCFAIWYAADCPRSKKLAVALPPDKQGRKPKESTISGWIRSWSERATSLDLQTTDSLDALLVKKRLAMFERHAKTGASMVEMGREYLESEGKGIKSDASAIRSIKEGSDLERRSLGMTEMLDIATMSDSQLQKLAADLLAEDEDIIDAEFEEKAVGEDE